MHVDSSEFETVPSKKPKQDVSPISRSMNIEMDNQKLLNENIILKKQNIEQNTTIRQLRKLLDKKEEQIKKLKNKVSQGKIVKRKCYYYQKKTKELIGKKNELKRRTIIDWIKTQKINDSSKTLVSLLVKQKKCVNTAKTCMLISYKNFDLFSLYSIRYLYHFKSFCNFFTGDIPVKKKH